MSNGRLSQLASSLASLTSQREQKLTEQARIGETIETQRSLIATLQDRVTMRSTAAAKQADTRSSVIDAAETLKYQVTQLAVQQGQMSDALAGAGVLEKEIDKTTQSFVSDNAQKLGNAERQIDDLIQKLAKATAEREHKTILAPISGTIQTSVITNVGQVVTVGQEVMRIVPDDSKLELQVYVLNADIGFVKAGQEAVVKIQSFPFTRYGTITARVTNMARYSVQLWPILQDIHQLRATYGERAGTFLSNAGVLQVFGVGAARSHRKRRCRAPAASPPPGAGSGETENTATPYER